MSKTIITEGRTTTEAIEKGLKELNTSKEMVDIEVLENQEKRSFFSILSPRIVKVKITLKDIEQIISENYTEKKSVDLNKEEKKLAKKNLDIFLDDFCKKMNNLKYNIRIDEKFIYIDFEGEKASNLIGYHGETLNSLQLLLSCIANKNINHKVRLIVDSSNYREKRKKALEQLAYSVEKKVINTGKQVLLDPMPAYERKVIHNYLQNNKDVTTYSVGEEPYRKVVVTLK